MLQAVYDYAERHGYAEVSVEDPNPKFRLVRDLVDVRNCKRRGLMRPSSTSDPPAAEMLEAARGALRVTDEQLLRAYELQQYAMLQALIRC